MFQDRLLCHNYFHSLACLRQNPLSEYTRLSNKNTFHLYAEYQNISSLNWLALRQLASNSMHISHVLSAKSVCNLLALTCMLQIWTKGLYLFPTTPRCQCYRIKNEKWKCRLINPITNCDGGYTSALMLLAQLLAVQLLSVP